MLSVVPGSVPAAASCMGATVRVGAAQILGAELADDVFILATIVGNGT